MPITTVLCGDGRPRPSGARKNLDFNRAHGERPTAEGGRRHTEAITILFLLTLACTPREQPVARAHVRLNVNPSMTYAPIMIAKDEGFFAQEGIDAEFVSLDSNSAVTAAVAGKIDVLSAGIRSGVFNVILKGVPLQVVADKGHADGRVCSAEAFIAPTDMAKAIEANGGSLRGQRIGLIRGGSVEYITMRLIAQRGNKLQDVVILQMPQGTAASSRDKFDGVRFTTEPNLSSAMSEGWASIVATGETVAPGLQNSVLVYGKRLLQDDPDLGHRFMRAYLRGARRYNEGKTERNVAIISKYTKLSPEIIRRSCWIPIASDGHIDPKAVQPFLDWALEERYLDGPIAVTKWWNPTFVDAEPR